MSRGKKHGIKAEINVTPLVDVVFVLLIVFMVVTPMIASGKDVQLPAVFGGGATNVQSAQAPVVVSITVDARLWLDSAEVTRKALAGELARRLKLDPNLEILVKADERVLVSDVRPVLKAIRSSGSTRIGFAVAPRSSTGRGAP